MADIHQFRPKEAEPEQAAGRRVWVCDRGCSTFSLIEDSTAECASCGAPHEGLGSGWLERVAGIETRHAQADTFADVQGNGSVEFARRRIAAKAQDDEAALIVIAYDSGSVTAWSKAETPEQAAWADEKLQQAAGLVAKRVHADG